MVGTLPYFYDGQLRRVIIQFMRVFSGFRIKTGKNSNGFEELITVPVVYGDGSNQAFSILNNNSENTITSVPRISCYITSLTPAALMRGSYQGNQEDLLVTERNFDEETNNYGNKPGNRYHIKRLQPNPVDIRFKVDIWTSSTDQKMQLFEQIFILFNPSLDIQTTSSPMDWTALQTITLEDVNWEEAGVPRADATLSILSFTFNVQSYINPPARVKKQTLIETIIQRIGDSIEECDGAAAYHNGETPLSLVTTPGNHSIQVLGNHIVLLGPYRNLVNENGETYSWPQLIDEYGEIIDGRSKIKLRWVSDIEDDSKDIIGYINYHPSNDNLMMFYPISETLPMATQMPVLGIIHPHEVSPGDGLPNAVVGQRYIITDEVGTGSVKWGTLEARPNDIIEYNGSDWIVTLSANTTNTLEFVTDESSTDLLKLLNNQWVQAINNQYEPGYFRLML